MTKMLIDRSTVEQALEALELYVPKEDYENRPVGNVIDALRAALAEPVEPVAHKHEWFSTGAMKPGQMRCIHCGVWNHEIPPQRPAEPVQESQGCDHCNHPLYAAVKCRMCGRVTEPTTEDSSAVEPVQEPKPVAWLYRGNLHPFDPSDGASDPATPLYAHPPQRPAEPVEPVAWADKISFESAMKIGKGHDVWPKAGDYEARTGRALIGLHTTPPQRKPLAEWQINDLMADIDPEDRDSWSFRQGVYAAEKHHGVRK